MSADIKFSKAQIKKMAQSGGFLERLLGRLLPKAIPAAVQKSMFGSGPTTDNNKLTDIMRIMRITNSGLSDMMKIIKVLKDHNILPKGITRIVKNEIKYQIGGFLPMLLGGLANSLLGGILSNGLFGSGMYRAGEGIIRTGEGIKKNH